MEKRYERLQNYAHLWFSTAQQDAVCAAIFKKKGYGKLATLWEEESTEEFDEAKKINARLLDLGFIPTFGCTELKIFEDPKTHLEDFAKNAPAAIADLNQLSGEFEDDFVTRKMVEDFVEGETEHLMWVQKHLAVIEAIGYENYLIEQVEL